MAGPHQIWKLNIETGKIGVWAGSGHENIQDGDLGTAKFAQPSGLATDGENLFVADSEVSGHPGDHRDSGTDDPRCGRIVGEGPLRVRRPRRHGPEVRLQHCLGVAYGDGKLYIADTYNNKIKVCRSQDPRRQDPRRRRQAGRRRQPARFYQPGGLSVAGTSLYVADTNNHKIRVIDLKTGDGQDPEARGTESTAGRAQGRGRPISLKTESALRMIRAQDRPRAPADPPGPSTSTS